jgi:hypothetical protein
MKAKKLATPQGTLQNLTAVVYAVHVSKLFGEKVI